MLTQERYHAIEELVRKRGAVTVTELTQLLDTSESTIRRDLTTLDEMGKIQKVHGGATVVEQQFITDEEDVSTKKGQNVEEKIRIAKYAASLVLNNDFVYLDAGTTTELMIDYITTTNATFVTNGIVHAKKLIAKGFKTFIIGGLVKPVTEAIIGADAVNNMQKFNFTKAFMGTNGIHTEYGFTTVDVEEAALKSEAVKRSYVNFVLADHSKFDKVTAVTFAPLAKSCIITDQLTNDKYKEATIIKEVTGI